VTLLLVVINAVVLIFLVQVVSGVRREVRDLRSMTQTQAGHYMAGAENPADLLHNECSSCHSERRMFAHEFTHGEIDNVLDRMVALPDAHISADKRERLDAAMLLVRCERCHAPDVFDKLGVLPRSERQATVMSMWSKPGATFSRQELSDILQAYDRMHKF
jgi:hypothetical protein